MGFQWIVLVFFFSGPPMSVPLDGRGTKEDCKRVAEEIAKEMPLPVKRVVCVPKYPET